MHGSRQCLRQRQQDLRPLGRQLRGGEVGSHADNGELLLAALFQSELHPFADRLRGGKQLLGERLGNHRDGSGRDAVFGGDRSTSQQPRADGLEKIFPDVRDVRGGRLGVGSTDAGGAGVEVDRDAGGGGGRGG